MLIAPAQFCPQPGPEEREIRGRLTPSVSHVHPTGRASDSKQ